MENLTIEDKKKAINAKITQHWNKMCQDEKRITSYMSDKWDDLLVFCLEEFLTKKPIDYQYEVAVVNDKLPNFMGRSMSLNLKSQSSPYWYKIRQHLFNTRGSYLTEQGEEFGKFDHDEIPDPDMAIEDMNPRECMSAAVEKLDFYHRQLITDYFFNELTYKQIQAKYGIPLNSVQKDTKKAIKLLQQHCSQFVPKNFKAKHTKNKQ